MHRAGKSFKTISAEMSIPVQALYSKSKWERMSPEQKARKNARSRASREGTRVEKLLRVRKYDVEATPPRIQFERAIIRPSAELIAERDRRLSQMPRDLTAALCGDPLPGYSALERRA